MNQETLYIAPVELFAKMKQLREVEQMDFLYNLLTLKDQLIQLIIFCFSFKHFFLSY